MTTGTDGRCSSWARRRPWPFWAWTPEARWIRVSAGDSGALARAATLSARAHQALLPHPLWARATDLGAECGALGINVAHSFGNGAAELVHLLVAALAPPAALVLAPTFARYGAALAGAGVVPAELPAWPARQDAAAARQSSTWRLVYSLAIIFRYTQTHREVNRHA